jgi:phosphatidylglycerol:prolipoprotein diacylglycerol transferase
VISAAAIAAVHTAMEWLAILVGARLYLRASGTSLRETGRTRNFAVIFGCIAGAAIGNKAVHWIHHAERWELLRESPWLLLQGQSIVGGLLGGLIGVEIAKACVGLRESTGDRFVVPILVGLIIGRIGCFIAGLGDDTYGNATTLPWGVDFGDGVRRHPTQLYDIAYAITALALWSRFHARLRAEPGLAFKLLLASYLAWRLAIDGLKPVPYEYWSGLGGIQLVCALALVFYLPLTLRQAARLR